ncbi:uncharacterized protein F5147DRAFT_774067 [Suillus discolor]|uniref:Uncharacterized protein n=1 Tax=Suillus discolor TaxID=1912936 RepID=A0A9P7F6H7_9AGAM|nr:uncharacterized protein F5147DRAFT_774067 [Suillus discolor]KAG2107620.1 hypothetical protein F5147DRAFT_774067 [Suillus discolor]
MASFQSPPKPNMFLSRWKFPEKEPKTPAQVFESPHGYLSLTGLLSTPPQCPCYSSNSTPPSSPLSSRATSMVSETDPEDSFPLTPDSKSSGGAYYHLTGTPSKTKSRSSSRAKHRSDGHSFHPYRQPPCFQDIHTFDNLLGRPASDNRLEAPDSKTDDVFLRHMDGLSPTSCRYVVRYKEAVHERQRMRLFMTYWELEETNRLRTLLTSLYAETNAEFQRAEQDAQALLKTLVTKQSLTCVVDDAQYLDATRQSNKTSLRETDAQLDLMRDHIMQRLLVKSFAEDSDSPSHCIGDSPSAADD